jgi:hypothetical protein
VENLPPNLDATALGLHNRQVHQSLAQAKVHLSLIHRLRQGLAIANSGIHKSQDFLIHDQLHCNQIGAIILQFTKCERLATLPLSQRNNTNPPLGIRLNQAKIEFGSQSIRVALFAQATEMIIAGITNKSGSTTIKFGAQVNGDYWNGKVWRDPDYGHKHHGIGIGIGIGKTYSPGQAKKAARQYQQGYLSKDQSS